MSKFVLQYDQEEDQPALPPVTVPGDYLASFDPDADEGAGSLICTDQLALAMSFPNWEAAMSFYRTQSTVKPDNPDGTPNMPLVPLNIRPVVVS